MSKLPRKIEAMWRMVSGYMSQCDWEDYHQNLKECREIHQFPEELIERYFKENNIKPPKEKEATQELENKIALLKEDSFYTGENDEKIISISPPNRAKNTHEVKIHEKASLELKDIINLPLKFWTKDNSYALGKFLHFLDENDYDLGGKSSVKVSLEKAYEKYVKYTELQQSEKEPLSEEEIEEAKKLSENPEILLKILEFKEKKLRHAGEGRNFLMLILVGTSRMLNRPISITGKGPSSVGKSITTGTALKFFPESEVIDFTRLTSHALYYAGNLNFRHKILYVYEHEGSDDSNYSIRTLQSEGKLKLGLPVKNIKTGEIEMQYKTVEGPVAFIETTTQAMLNTENETRCFDIFMDEAESQTVRIFDLDKNQLLPIDYLKIEGELEPFRNMQRILNEFDVVIPFKPFISFPTKPLRVRRDKQKFLSLIEASAIIHQNQREKIQINGNRYIIANLFDYELARILAKDIITNIVRNLNPKTELIIEKAKSLRDKGKEINLQKSSARA